MPITIVPPGRNASAAALQKIFEETQDKLIAEILRKRSKGYVDYAEVAALERVRKTLQKMVKSSEKYVPLAVEHEFYKRPESAEAYRNARESINPGRTRAVEILSDNLLGDIEEMAETAYQSTASKLFLVGRAQEDIFREAALTSAVEASAAGRGSLTTVNEIIAAIQNTGITAFVDKAGHEWNLKAYGSMAVRTTVHQAQVAAVITEKPEQDLYKIVQSGSPCRMCAAYGGRVYSRSGANPNYPPLTAAFGKINPAGANDLGNSFLNIHPNCLCAITPWTELGKTPEEIQNARDFSNPEKRPFNLDYRTRQQKEAYETKERNRAIYRENVKQYRRYLESGVPGMPKHFQTFLKHKKLNDDKYKEWMSAYRKADKPARVKPVPAPYPKPVKPVFAPEPAVPVPPVEIPKPVEAKPLKQITKYSEVRKALKEDVGFAKVDPSIKLIDHELMVENTNQLIRLENKFGCIHKGRKTFGAFPGTTDDTVAFVRRPSRVNVNDSVLSLCPNSFKDRRKCIESKLKNVRMRWNMPMDERFASVGSVTHEYGHILQNVLIQEKYEEAGLTTDAKVWGKLRSADFKKDGEMRNAIRKETQKAHREEILGIAREIGGKNVLSELSEYGKTDEAEFFAEVFANSQLGKPNSLGKAMNVWLERKGW